MYSLNGWPTDVRSTPNCGGQADIAGGRRRADFVAEVGHEARFGAVAGF
jgi:hypothetical protein